MTCMNSGGSVKEGKLASQEHKVTNHQQWFSAFRCNNVIHEADKCDCLFPHLTPGTSPLLPLSGKPSVLAMDYFSTWRSNDCKYSSKTCWMCYTRVAQCWNTCRFFPLQPVSEWQNQRGGVWLRFADLCGDILLHWLLPFPWHTAWVQISQIKEVTEEYLWDLKSQPWHRTPFTVRKSSVGEEEKENICL